MQTNFILMHIKLLMFAGIGGTSARGNFCPASFINIGPFDDD
jgi:hypothetical protein